MTRIVARHEALRTSFAMVDGQPRQRMRRADSGCALIEHDLQDHPDAAAELARLSELEALDAVRPGRPAR